MKIPKTIKVDGIIYTIETTKTIDERKERTNWGKTN